jgi:hypothetical protein
MDADDGIVAVGFLLAFVTALLVAGALGVLDDLPAHPLCGVELPACADWSGDGSGLVCVPVTFPCRDAGP